MGRQGATRPLQRRWPLASGARTASHRPALTHALAHARTPQLFWDENGDEGGGEDDDEWDEGASCGGIDCGILREIAMLRLLNGAHPNVLSMRDVSRMENGTLALIMPKMAGSLAGAIEKQSLSGKDKLRVAALCLHSLAWLHSHGIIHVSLSAAAAAATAAAHAHTRCPRAGPHALNAFDAHVPRREPSRRAPSFLVFWCPSRATTTHPRCPSRPCPPFASRPARFEAR